MRTSRASARMTAIALAMLILPVLLAETSEPETNPQPLSLIVGKSQLVESALPIERIAVGYGDIAEASAVGLHEVLLNAKAPGVTSMIIWQHGGGKLFFDVTVKAANSGAPNRVDAVKRELARELPGQNVDLSYANDTAFLRGTVKDMVSAERAVAIASTLGRTVNLLYVDVPLEEQQILLKVRFATIDRSASVNLGMNLVSTGAGNTIGSVSTQQFSGPQIVNSTNGGTGSGAMATLSDALNLFFFRPDLNVMGAIQALQSKSLAEVLAEPDLLAMNGKPASFLAGGEFPYPTFQAGSNGIGSVTIQFREFGVRLNFVPTITPRGTIRLRVEPEVSALDFTNGLVVQGFTVPALTMRRVSTEIELAPGQSFAIGGLIDNSLTETVSKIPLLGDVPVLGKLFQSKSKLRENTELLVIVTPQLVAPIGAGQPAPGMKFPKSPDWPKTVPDALNPPAQGPQTHGSVPVETLIRSLHPDPKSAKNHDSVQPETQAPLH